MGNYRIAIVNSSSFGRRFPSQMERLKKIGEVKRITVDGAMHGKELAERLSGYNTSLPLSPLSLIRSSSNIRMNCC